MNKKQQLFSTPFGSHLYGTNTETSDIDTKTVVLPEFEDLIMNYRLSNWVEKPDGWTEGQKMNAGKEEIEFIPLQVFLDHFYEGQTYAVEMAFAVLQGKHTIGTIDKPEFLLEWMKELADRFLTNGIEKMVGYAVAQSRIYGLKNGRYNKLVELDARITHHFKGLSPAARGRLADTPDFIQQLVDDGFVQHAEVLNARGGTEPAPAIEIDSKLHTLTTSWQTFQNIIVKMLEKYGERVKDNTGEAVDWKAMSHAVRITEQIVLLATQRKISFPIHNAPFLLDIKQGKLPYKDVKEYLDAQFGFIHEVIADSNLPERTEQLDEEFRQWKLNLLKKYYGLNG